jgi:CHAT domain-containing protein
MVPRFSLGFRRGSFILQLLQFLPAVCLAGSFIGIPPSAFAQTSTSTYVKVHPPKFAGPCTALSCFTAINVLLPKQVYGSTESLGQLLSRPVSEILITNSTSIPYGSEPEAQGEINQSQVIFGAEKIIPISSSESIKAFNASEHTIALATARGLGVPNAKLISAIQVQKLLQEASTSIPKSIFLDNFSAAQPSLQHGGACHGFAVKPSSAELDSRCSRPIHAGFQYNPAIVSIRFTEAKGRTIDPSFDAFIDLTFIPAKGAIVGRRLELSSARFVGLLRQFYASISRQEAFDLGGSRSASRRLYELLIGPIAEQLQNQNVTTILIAADRGLQGVPFAALHDGKQFFGDRYAFSLTPSLSLTDLKLHDGTTNRLLTLGASQFNDGLAPLPLVPQELAKISALKTSEVLLNHSFTPKTLLGAASDARYGWIHVATHAEFLPGGPSQSRLFTGTDPLPLSSFSDLRKTRQDNPIDLFTLSACRTALGDSESELGFAGLAIQAGARSAIGTLWYVDDVATSAYFIQFYRYLKQGLPKAEALQATRRDFSRGRVVLSDNKILAANGELLLDNLSAPQQRRVASGLANPYFWAGIEMVGAPW